MHDAHVAAMHGLRSAFPRQHDIGEKTLARRGRFVEQLSAAIAVDPDGGSAQPDARRPLHRRERARDELRAADATVADFALYRVRPPLGDVLAGEVDDGVSALEGGRIELAALRIPENRFRSGTDRRTCNGHDAMSGGTKVSPESRAEEAGGPGDGDAKGGCVRGGH